MERTSTFAGMWRVEASRRGGCCESRAMDRRGQASAAVNCSRWRSGDRAKNGCAMVPVGSGAREGPTHGVPGGGSTVAGCGRRLWSGVGEGGWWVGEGGGGGGISRGKRSGPGGSGMQSDQCCLQWRKVRRGGGLAGLARVGAVAGRGVRREVVTVGGASGEGRGVAAPLGWRCPVRRVRGVGRGCSTDIGQSWAPGCGGVWGWWVSPATGVLLRGGDEDADCTGTEAGEPGAGVWGAGGGLSPAGMAGVPWGPVGAEAPHVGRVRNHNLCFRHRSS